MTRCKSKSFGLCLSTSLRLGLLVGLALVSVRMSWASDNTLLGPGSGGWADGQISLLPPVDAGPYDLTDNPPTAPSLLPFIKAPGVMLTSYQDEPPVPPGNAGNQQNGNQEKQPLGQKPVDNSEVFLRSETVLLEPGQWEMDYGFEYVWHDALGLTVLPGPAIALERVRLRQLFVPMAFRFGLTERIQPFINVPWGGAEFERDNVLTSNTDTDFGIGDVSAGFSYLLCSHEDKGVDWILNTGFTAPTGTSPFGNFNAINNFASLGQGFWAINANLNWVRSIDPCVLFGGVGWSHEFDSEEMGFNINPGEIFTYQFGMGFAVNDNITLSTLFQGQWQERFQVDDVTIPNSSQEPFSIRMEMTIVYSKRCIIEPFVRFGLDVDAPQADFGVVITRRSCN